MLNCFKKADAVVSELIFVFAKGFQTYQQTAFVYQH